MQTTTKLIGCALIGVRGYGAVIADRIKKSGAFDLRLSYHRDAVVAEETAKVLGSRGTHQVDEIWKDPEVKAVFIVVPNQLHFAFIQDALKAGKHVFVEKPMTETLAEAQTVGELLKPGQVLMVGHNYRRKAGFRLIKKMLEAGELGFPVSFEMINSHGGAYHFTPTAWRAKAESCSGGPLTMLGTHSFDTAEYLFGKTKTITSIVRHLQSPIEAPDTSSSMLNMENGTVCYFSNHYNVPSCTYAQLHATEGSMYYNFETGEMFHRTGRDVNRVAAPTQKVSLPTVDDRLEQIQEFALAIENGTPVETGFEQGYRAVAFVTKAMESFKKQTVVHF